MKKTAVYDIDVMMADIYAWIKALAISPVNILDFSDGADRLSIACSAWSVCGVQHSIIRGKSLACEF